MSIVFLGIIKQPTTTISRFKISVGQKTCYEDACHWCSAPQVTGYQSEKKKIFETPIYLPIPTQVHNLITMCYKIGETTVQNTASSDNTVWYKIADTTVWGKMANKACRPELLCRPALCQCAFLKHK